MVPKDDSSALVPYVQDAGRARITYVYVCVCLRIKTYCEYSCIYCKSLRKKRRLTVNP